MNCERMKFFLRSNGTVQSKMALQAMPCSRIVGSNAGSLDGSSTWQWQPGMVMRSTSAWKRVVMAHITSLISKMSTSSSTKITCLSSENAEKASMAALR